MAAQPAKDIFGTEAVPGTAWQMEGAVLQIEGAENLVVASANLSYGRPIQQVTPINQNRRFLLTGKPAGSLAMGMLVGPYRGLKQFLKDFSNPCRVNENVITVLPAGLTPCEGDTVITRMVLHGCIIGSLQYSVQGNDSGIAIVNGNITMQFFFLTHDEN